MNSRNVENSFGLAVKWLFPRLRLVRSAVDDASAQWLAHEARLAGAEISLEPFSLSRVDPESCYLRIGEHRIEAVPLFDAGFTGPEGVEGVIGPLGSEAEIALVESEIAEPAESSNLQPPGEVAEARRSRH